MQERRKFTRIPYEKYMFLDSQTGEQYQAEIENICIKGALVRVLDSKRFGISEEFSFRIILSEDESSQVRGVATIMWGSDHNSYGLKFSEMDEDSLANLIHILEYHMVSNEEIHNDLENLIE